MGLVVGRCSVADAGADVHLERGLGQLARGIQGEAAQYAEAEESFARASGGSIFDAYPLFLLELTRALREGRADQSDPAVRPVLRALSQGDFDAALAGLPGIPEDFVGRQHLERAVIELARRKPQ